MLNGLGGRFKSLSLFGIIRSCRSNPYGIVGLLESESNVTICGSSDALDSIEIISQVSFPGPSVELRTIRVFDLGRLWSFDDCPRKTHQSYSNSLINCMPFGKILNFELNKYLLSKQLNGGSWNQKVIGIAGNDTSLSSSGVSFDVPA